MVLFRVVMKIEQDLGLVLKKTLYQDTKLIVNVFTKTEGLISFSVTIGKNPSKKFGCFEVGNILKLEFSKRDQTRKLHDATIHFSPFSLRKDLELICLYARFIDTLYHLLKEGCPNPLFFEFLQNGLMQLESHPLKKDLVYFIFLKWLQNEGFLDETRHCDLKLFLHLKKFSQLQKFPDHLIQMIDDEIAICLK